MTKPRPQSGPAMPRPPPRVPSKVPTAPAKPEVKQVKQVKKKGECGRGRGQKFLLECLCVLL